MKYSKYNINKNKIETKLYTLKTIIIENYIYYRLIIFIFIYIWFIYIQIYFSNILKYNIHGKLLYRHYHYYKNFYNDYDIYFISNIIVTVTVRAKVLIYMIIIYLIII